MIRKKKGVKKKNQIRSRRYFFFCPRIALGSKRQARWVPRMIGCEGGLARGHWLSCTLTASPCCPLSGLPVVLAPLRLATLGKETTLWGLNTMASEGTEEHAQVLV